MQLRRVIPLFLLLALFVAIRVAGAPFDLLFREVDAPPGVERGQSKGRVNYIHISKETLVGNDPAHPPEGVTLNLFPDVSIIAMRDRIEWEDREHFSWFGHVAGVPLSQVIFVYLGDDGWAGGVVQPKAQYNIQLVSGDTYAVTEKKGADLEPPKRENDARKEPEWLEPDGFHSMDDGDAPPNDGRVVDVLIPYTAAAVSTAGNIKAWIAYARDYTNQSFRNSGIDLRVRIVYQYQTNYTEVGGDLNTDISRLESRTDGYADDAHPYRDKYGADLVSLWEGPSHTGTVGRGDMINTQAGNAAWAFSVIADYDLSGYAHTFAHEVGHNFGCDHDTANATGGVYAYSHGFNGGGLGTIMSYPGTRIAYYSSPLRSVSGTTIGTANAEDNARTITNTKASIAGYRNSVVPDSVFTTNLSEKTSMAGCFIATAAYGSPMEKEVVSLRKFRNNVLAPSYPGRALMRAYYAISPPIAQWISGSERLKSWTRTALRPVVSIAKKLELSDAREAMGRRE